jgi:hypothetical protein
MAMLDEQEARVEQLDAAEVDVDDELTAPLDESRAAEILDAVMKASSSRPSAAPVVAAALPRARARWVRSATLAVGVSMAAALALCVARTDAPDPLPTLVPHHLELGGTARVLGPTGDAPRAYGPGDELLLRAVPERPDTSVPDARLFATPQGGGPRRVVGFPAVRAADGALELRGDITEWLPAGRYVLRLELGGPSRCDPGGQGCVEAEVPIEVLDR